MKPFHTVVYKLKGKLHIGMVNTDYEISHFEFLRIANPLEFNENVFYLMMAYENKDDGIFDITELHDRRYDFSGIEDDEFVMLANVVIREFKNSITFH